MNAKKLAILLVAAVVPAAIGADHWDRVPQIAPKSTVRVKMYSGEQHKGTLAGANADSLRLNEDGHEVSLGKADIARVEEYQPSRRLRHALIGAAIGTGVGIVAGYATCPTCPGETNPDDFHQRLAVGGAAGAGIGAGLGALGSSYHTVYKGPRK